MRSLVEATDMGSLSLNLRSDVRVYYSAPTPADLAFKVLACICRSDWALICKDIVSRSPDIVVLAFSADANCAEKASFSKTSIFYF